MVAGLTIMGAGLTIMIAGLIVPDKQVYFIGYGFGRKKEVGLIGEVPIAYYNQLQVPCKI